ncbi:MAG: 2Fe-2S iron-sulfur cluster-binding protein [Steroidobacteraceae bacterium]
MTAFSFRILHHTLRVRPDEILLDAALAAGLDAPHSCQNGYCGSCRARLVSGTIEYPSGRVVPADITQGFDIMLCLARARSDIEVELPGRG